MASLSLYPQFETNLMSTRKVIELLLQLKSAKAHGKNYIKVKPHLVRHLLRNCLLHYCCYYVNTPVCTNDCPLLFPDVNIDWNRRGYIIFDRWHPN